MHEIPALRVHGEYIPDIQPEMNDQKTGRCQDLGQKFIPPGRKVPGISYT